MTLPQNIVNLIQPDQKDFFCDQDRENYNTEYRNREIEKQRNNQYLIHISRSQQDPQEIHLGNDEVVAKPPEKSSGLSSRSNNELGAWKKTAEEKRKYIQEKMRLQAKALYDNPDEMFYFCVSVYHYRPSKPDRLSINIDFIQSSGSTPFKVKADCVSRARKRELLCNVKDPNWQGYQLALHEATSKPNRQVFIGKMKNRAKNNSYIKKILIPNTVVIATVNPHDNTIDVELIINDQSYVLTCQSVDNQFFSHKAEYQNNEEEMYDF